MPWPCDTFFFPAPLPEAFAGARFFAFDLTCSTFSHKKHNLTGGEFPYVIFWNQTDPREHWTRPNAYVAVSRGKECVWIACEPADFFTVCAQPETRRRTVFGELIGQRLSDVKYKTPVRYKPSPIVNPKTLKQNKTVKCVPLLSDEIKE